MKDEKMYLEYIWYKAVAEAEADVMRACPTLVGGRKPKETVEQYAHRGIVMLEKEIAKLSIARKKLADVKKHA